MWEASLPGGARSPASPSDPSWREPADAGAPTDMGAPSDAAEPPGGGALRIAGGCAETVLEQFRGSPLLAAGKIVVIALDPIAERLGPRWGVRQELVHEHAERVLRRELGAEAVVQRINETEYLVAQSALPRLAGQLRCITCVQEILHHFLGAAAVGDIRVHEVTRVTDEGVFGRRLDPGEVEAAEAFERRSAAPEAAAPRSLDRWSPFTTSRGQRVGVSCSLEPVLHLRNSDRIGYRIAARLQHLPAFAALTRRELEGLSPADLERIDFATIARGLDRILTTAAEPRPPMLIVPVSYATLQGRRGRATIIGLLHKGRDVVQHGVICEITGAEGAPAAALHETIGSLRPFCLRVIGRTLSEDARHFLGQGVDGLSIRCPRHAGDAEFIGWARGLVRVTERITKTLFLYQAEDLRHAKLAAELGITHATLAPQRLKLHFIDDEPG